MFPPGFARLSMIPASNRIHTRHHDDWNRIGHLFGREDCRRHRCDEDVDLRLHQLGDQPGNPCRLPSAPRYSMMKSFPSM